MKRTTSLLALLICLYFSNSTKAQVNFTANDFVPEYNAPFGFGINLGWHRGWTDEQLADIAIGNAELGIEGVGINTLRPALPENFLEEWGYDIRVETFQSHVKKGADQNVVFIGYPSEEHRSKEEHCPGVQSEMFANIYEPIWDDGLNGTPYNEENYYAAYVYEMVSRYGKYIRFYEIWNEPDFPKVTFLVQNREEARNWWDNNPYPCDYELRAPIFYYIRILRISYEIIKTLDTDAYIAVGGLGKTAFLDAILRNTDNPNDGQIMEDYPLKGGAYFDVLSYHSYPHVDGSLQTWNNDRRAFDYSRHSDAAVDGLLRLRDEFEAVLFNYGYDDDTYPEKEWILTETNLPRIAIGERIGSVPAQVNYMIKCIVEAQRANILQVHPYKLGDTDRFSGNSEFDPMGLYDNLENNPPYTATATDLGVAYKTISDALLNKSFDAAQTTKMNLPERARGAAFVDEEEQYTYVVWAITETDRSEFAEANIDLSNLLGTKNWAGRQWEYSKNDSIINVNPSQIKLTGAPLILLEDEESDEGGGSDDLDFSANLFSAFPNPFLEQITVDVRLIQQMDVKIDIVNRFGQLTSKVMEAILPTGEYQYTINTSDWANGIYYMQVRSAGNLLIWTQLVKMEN